MVTKPGPRETATDAVHQVLVSAPEERNGTPWGLNDAVAQLSSAEALAEQLNLLQTFMDNAPVMMSMFDSNGKLVYVNKETERVTGWSEAEMRADPDLVATLYPEPEDYQAVTDFIRDSARRWAQFELTTRGGSKRLTEWMNVRAGRFIVGIGIDVTDRQRARMSERDAAEGRIDRVVAGMPYGLTFRELSVLALVCRGKTDREIAEVLAISLRTVQTHIVHILAKMEAKTRTAAAVRAIREQPAYFA